MKGAQQLLQATYKAALASSRQYASSASGEGRKVAVLGAAGGIGQPLSLLMKVRYWCVFSAGIRAQIRILSRDR